MPKKNDVCWFVSRLPKTTITATVSAFTVYGMAKGFIGNDEATLISALMLATGLVVNRDKFVGKHD